MLTLETVLGALVDAASLFENNILTLKYRLGKQAISHIRYCFPLGLCLGGYRALKVALVRRRRRLRLRFGLPSVFANPTSRSTMC